MMDQMIRTPYGQMPTYVAVPPATGPWPGVVVIQDFAGMSHDLRNQADWLGGEGYLAAAQPAPSGRHSSSSASRSRSP
jgi:carboxymethylenebutenolidase